MNYKILTLPAIFAALILVAGAGCSTSTTPTAEKPAVPKECGDDLACGNALLAACAPGTFTAMDDRTKVYVTVSAKNASGCPVMSAIDANIMGEFTTKYDTDANGKIDLLCNLPSSVKDFAALSQWVKDDKNTANCTGDMMKLNEDLKAMQ